MKNYRSNVAFIDLLFNLLVGFVSLFIIAYMLINPVAKTGIVDPNIEIMITMSWDDKSPHDYDIWVDGPQNTIVGFTNKESGYMTLERDDLGTESDRFYDETRGVWVNIERNLEVVAIRGLVPGVYYVNVHFFALKQMKPGNVVTVEVTDMRPYQIVAKRDKEILANKSEHTMVSFRVTNNGKIVDVDYNAKIDIVRGNIHAGGPL